jgi:histidine phosphotransferase ChpT
MRLAHSVPALLAGQPENDTVDAHGIQAFYTGLVARTAGMAIEVRNDADGIVLMANAVMSEEAAA